MAFTPALSLRLDDPKQEQVRLNTDERIRELQRTPAAGLVVISGVELADGVATKIVHRLGRRPLLAFPSFVRGAISTGRIDQDDSKDPGTYFVLTASGFGATITIDIGVL